MQMASWRTWPWVDFCRNVYLILDFQHCQLQNIILKHDWSQSANSARNHTSLNTLSLRLSHHQTLEWRLSHSFSPLCAVLPTMRMSNTIIPNYFDHLNSFHLNNEYGEKVLTNILAFGTLHHLFCLYVIVNPLKNIVQLFGRYLLHISFSPRTFSKVRVGERPLPL